MELEESRILKYRTMMQLLHGMIGACITGIPLAVLLLFQIHDCTALRHQISDYQRCEQNGLYLYVWTLKQDISAGDKITKTDLEQKKAWVPQNTSYAKSMDLRQFTGKKAVCNLKKGTVLQTDLLSSGKKKVKAKP